MIMDDTEYLVWDITHLPVVMIPANAECKYFLISNIFK